jgi:hypothetical protein
MLGKVLRLTSKRGQKQLHQSADLGLRTLPILATEGEQGKHPYATLATCSN